MTQQAKANFEGMVIHNVVNITITAKGIKEFINQPAADYIAKNELSKQIPEIIAKAKYIGSFPAHGADKNPNLEASLFYEIELLGETKYLIMHKFKNGDINFHSISTHPPK